LVCAQCIESDENVPGAGWRDSKIVNYGCDWRATAIEYQHEAVPRRG
jgi:hypothetical protein